MSNSVEGLNIILNSADPQTQAMAIVLALKTLKQHKKQVKIVLCGAAGDLADLNIQGIDQKRPDGSSVSAKDQLKGIIKEGASVKVCPLYLPNANKNKDCLLDGIEIADPGEVAARLLSNDWKNISF